MRLLFAISNLYAGAPRALMAGCALTLAACGMDSTEPSAGLVHYRVVNALAVTRPGASTLVGMDYLIDSSAAAPSVLGMAPHSISTGDSANGYRVMPRGVHSFVARRTGDARRDNSVFTTSNNQAYLPRLAMIPDTYYTLIVGGIVPDTGSVVRNTVPFQYIIDDPGPGPVLETTGVRQARFRVYHVAPFADSAGGTNTAIGVIVTPGATPPANPTSYRVIGGPSYRTGSSYFNLTPGPYVITFTAFRTNVVVAQQTVNFVPGEVRSFFVFSTAGGPPGTSNHTVVSVLDHQY